MRITRQLSFELMMAMIGMLAVGTAGGEDSNTVHITLLHTSDLHGQVLPLDGARDRSAPGSLARVSAAVAEVRAEVDHPVLLLDSGDTLQGTPLEEYVHVRFGEPSPVVEAMNLIGYEAMAIGNHDFNFGLDVLERAREQADFPFLSANTVDEVTGRPAFTPYVVREIGGVRVGILGVVTSNIPGWEDPVNYRGLRFEPTDEAARRWVRVLHEVEGCDLVVVLAHTGFETDPETGESDGTEYENFGDRLGAVPGIDVLLTGHAHDDIPPRRVGDAIVSQPLSRGRRLTRIDLELEVGEDGWTVATWRGENLDLTDTAVDDALVAVFMQRWRRVQDALARPLTTVAEPVSVRNCRLHDCAAQDLIHVVQLDASGADVSMASLLTNGTPDLAPGPVTRRWVRSLYTYPNTLVSVELTGAQLKDVIEHAARYYDGVDCSLGPCALIADPDIRHYNVDSFQGVSYRIDPTRPEGDRVLDLRRNGAPLKSDATLTLACNNYRAAGGGGFPHLAQAPVVWRSPREVADLISEWLDAREIWLPEADENWLIAPDFVDEKRVDRNAEH